MRYTNLDIVDYVVKARIKNPFVTSMELFREVTANPDFPSVNIRTIQRYLANQAVATRNPHLEIAIQDYEYIEKRLAPIKPEAVIKMLTLAYGKQVVADA